MNQSSKQRAFSFIELQRVDSLSSSEDNKEKEAIQYAQQTKVVPKFFEKSPPNQRALSRKQKTLKKSNTAENNNVIQLIVKPPLRGNIFPQDPADEFQSPLIKDNDLTEEEKHEQEQKMLEDISMRSKSKLQQEQELIDNIVHQTLSRDDESGSKSKEKESRKFKIFDNQQTQYQDFEGSSDDEEQSLVIKSNKVLIKSPQESIPTSVKVKNLDFKSFIGQSLYDSKFQTIWVLLLIFSLTYNYFTCFYFLAIEGFPFDSWLFMELTVEIFLIIDFIINIFLMMKDKVSWRKMHMLRDKWDERPFKILLNFISIIPSSLILYLVYEVHTFAIIDIHINAIRIHKLLKFLDILIYFRNIEQIQKRKYRFSSISIIKIFYFLLITSHLMTCVWLVFNRTEKSDETWFNSVGLDQASSWEIYLEAAVYVLSTMMGCGLLNQFPKNQGEEIIVMVIIIFGATLFATFFSLFVVIIHHMNEEIIEKDQKLEQALNLSEQLGLKPTLKNKIKFYYSTIRLKFDELQKKYEAIQELPESIKQEISMKVYKDFIKKVKIFEFAEDSFIKDLCVNLNPEICLQSDYVVQEFEIADKIYFIMKGTVEALAHDKTTVLAIMEDGAFFGEVGVLITGIRTCSIRSKSSCLFYTISKKIIIQILKKHPLQTRVLFTIASQRYKITEDFKLNNHNKQEEVKDIQISTRRKDSLTDKQHGPQLPTHDEASKGENTFLEEKVKELPYKLYLPFSRFYKVWMGIILFVYIYNLLYVPFSIAFESHIPKEYVIFDILTILANMGQSNTSQFEIMNDYINHGWFILDVFSVIPLDYFFWAAGLDQNVIALARLVRLIKIFRIVEIIGIIKKIGNIQLTKYSLIISCFILCIFCHIIGCVFFLLGKYEYQWKDRFDQKTLFEDITSRPFLDYSLFPDMPKHEQYIHMLYFGAQYMSQIMQGDMIPYGHAEESLGILVLLFQKFLMSFILAQAEHYTASLHLQYSTHVKKMKEIAEWMNLKQMPKELINRVMKYEDLIWKKFKGNNMHTILNDLPETLQYETQYHLFKELIESVKIFPKDDVGALGSLIQRLRLVLYPKGEYVIMMGEIASDMYFIIHGKVHIYIQNNIKVAELGSGKYFGEIALIQETATLRNASALCVKNSQIAVLSQHDFDIIRKKHPQFDKAIKDEVKKRQIETLQKQEEGQKEQVSSPKVKYSKTRAHSVFLPPPVLETGRRSSTSISRSKTMDYYYDSKIFIKKLLTKKNAMLITTGIFSIYNVFAYPFLIAFKWRVYDHSGILTLELLTIVVYSCEIIMLVLQYKLLKKSRFVQYLSITQNTTRLFDDNDNEQEHLASGSDIKIRQIDKDLKQIKTKIIFQIISTLPLALICDLIPGSNSQIAVSVLKLLRIISYWPIFQFFKYFEKKAMMTIRIIQAIFLYYSSVHLFGCLFIHISTYEEHFDPLQTWIKRIPVRELLPQSPNSMANVTETTIEELSTYSVYIACLEFQVSMMSHIAKGDITAVTVRERAFIVFVMIIYFYLFALIFGDVVSIISELIPVNFMRLNQRYHMIMSRIQKDKLREESVYKIREYYDDMWKKSKGINEKFIQHLPGNIKNEIRLFQYQDAFQQCSLFYDLNGYIQLPLIKSLIQMLQIRTYQRHDFVSILGSYDQNSYFLLDGVLCLYGANRQYVGFMRTGSYFSNLCSKNFGNKCLANIFSDGISIVGVLPFEKHQILSQAYPDWYDLFQEHNMIKMNILEVYLNEYLTSKGMVICEESQMKILEQIATNDKTENYDLLVEDYRSVVDDAHGNQYDFLTNIEDEFFKDNKQDRRYLATKEWAELNVNTHHPQNSRFKFKPNSIIVQTLDFLHGFNLLYIAICVPIQIGYTIQFSQAFIITEILSLTVSVFYTLIKLRTPIEIQGEQTLEFKAIVKYYYKHQGLIWDLFSLLPINLFLGISYSGRPHLPVDLIRLTRTLALGGMPNVYEKLQLKFRKHNYSVQLTKPILFFYIFWQWQACFWFYINVAFEANMEESWLKEKGFENSSDLSHQFSASMYLTIDQRAETAQNTLEFTIMVILINLGDVLITVSFGLLSGITMKTSNETEAERAYNKMDDVLRYLGEYSIDEDIKKKIRNFYSYSWSLQKKSKLLVLEELDSVLPYKLSREIVYYSSRDLLLPMFGKFNSENFIKDISLYLENVIYMPETYIVIKDEIGEEMFFIAEGSVNVLTSDRKKITLNKGAFFGEIAIFLNTKRTTFVKSASYCSIFMLKKVHIIKILKTYPSIQEQFKKEAEIRIQQIRQMQAKPVHLMPKQSQSSIQEVDEDSSRSDTQQLQDEEETPSLRKNHQLTSIKEVEINEDEEYKSSSEKIVLEKDDHEEQEYSNRSFQKLNIEELPPNYGGIEDLEQLPNVIMLSQHSKRSQKKREMSQCEDQNSQELLNFKKKAKHVQQDVKGDSLFDEDQVNISHQSLHIPMTYEFEKLERRESSVIIEQKKSQRKSTRRQVYEQ